MNSHCSKLLGLASLALAALAQAAEPKATYQNTAPADLLLRYTPTNSVLAQKFNRYVTREVGFLSYGIEGTGTARTITNTIVVPPNMTYDGKGEVLTADAASMSDGKGEQSERQKPLFILCPGASLKNVTITKPGCDGIHMMGDNVLDHVIWQKVGEDAASVRSYFPGGKITIKNCQAFRAQDKVFQFNTSCNVSITNFVGVGMGKLLKHMASTDVPFSIDLNTVTVSNAVSAVVQSDSKQCQVRYHNLTYSFGSKERPERVFREIPKENVTQY
jgi:pectate lyase C